MRTDNACSIAVAADFNRETPTQTGTALVPLDNVCPNTASFRQPRTQAAFVAQLIAKSQNVPHLRDRRRATPAEANEAYTKMVALSGVPKRYKARPY